MWMELTSVSLPRLVQMAAPEHANAQNVTGTSTVRMTTTARRNIRTLLQFVSVQGREPRSRPSFFLTDSERQRQDSGSHPVFPILPQCVAMHRTMNNQPTDQQRRIWFSSFPSFL